MDQQNGKTSELGTALDRIIAAFARINTALRSLLERLLRLSDAHDASSERREKEYETVRGLLVDIKQGIAILAQLVTESRQDIRDITPPLGVPLQDPAQDSRHDADNKSGALVAFARLAEKVPTPWVGWLLKFAVSSSVGAAALRALQWLTTGH